MSVETSPATTGKKRDFALKRDVVTTSTSFTLAVSRRLRAPRLVVPSLVIRMKIVLSAGSVT